MLFSTSSIKRQATNEGKRLSKDDLKELYGALSPQATLSREVSSKPETDHKETERRQEVQEWMQKKREEMMKEFKARTSDLRAVEKRPYMPRIKTSTEQVSQSYELSFRRFSSTSLYTFKTKLLIVDLTLYLIGSAFVELCLFVFENKKSLNKNKILQPSASCDERISINISNIMIHHETCE